MLPVVNGHHVCIPLAVPALLEHICTVIAYDQAKEGLVGQCDFKHKVVWHGYMLAVLGVQVYRRVGQKWTKLLLPLVMVMCPTEDAGHYTVLFDMGERLLRLEYVRKGWQNIPHIFAQMHADYAGGARLACQHRLPGTLLVNDLEHMLRNLHKRQKRPTGLRSRDIKVVFAWVGLSAYLPTGGLFSLFWEAKFAALSGEMQETGFARYL